MAGVNKNLKASDSTYTGDTMTTPVEALLIDELSRSEVRGHIRTLAANGAYGTGAARDAAMGRNAAREIKYEVHGGITGWTSTKDLKEAMTLADTRGARLATEEVIKNEVKGSPNEGSYVRQYIKEDDLGLDWSAQEIDQFDATWIKNGAYDHEHDQEHRNAVTGRLVFEYGNEESLHAGLEAIDPETADYQYISQRAAEENQTNGYQAHFNGQDALQTYIAGRATDESGTVETPEVSACNTLLFKGEKPVRIQAEEALYDAKTGNFSNMFDSMDPKVYEEMADMIADGEVTGCKNIKEAYDKALNSTKNINDKTKIKANAIVSGQIEFSDAEVAEFCVELMHRIDSNRGSGASSHQSASATNIADYQTAQLKAILQARPEILASVKEKVQAGDFSYSVTIDNGPDAMPTRLDHNTKNDYLAIISDSKHVANEAVFYDKDGNQITNPEEIAALTNANMQALQGMREYVAQLERDFKKGVDAEGNLSNMANYILTYSGLGTDRDDVATQYRNAKIMLAQLEAAAQGKLRDSEGNVISVQDLAQKITETQDNLVTTNGDYQSSMQMARMGIVLAPVIAVTTVATMGTSTLLAGGVGASLGLATATGTGTFALTSAGVVTSNIVAGLAAGATTYGLNAYEYNTSLTGNTAEAREQNAIDSAVAGVSTFIGAQQMGPVSKLFNNANAFVRGGGRLTTVLASDVGVGAAGEYVQTGTVTVNGVAMNAIFSATGNFIGIKSLAKKVEIPANTPHVEINNHPSHDAEVVNQALRHEQVQADHHAGYVRKRQQEADKLAVDMDPAQNVVTPEQQAAYNREVAYQPVPEADRPAFEAHQQQVAQAHAEAHELGNMVDPSSVEALQRAKANMEADAPAATPEPPVAPAPKSANQEAIDKLTQSIEDLDKQIARAESNMKSAARRGKRVTPQQEQQLARMKENRAAKQAELDALQKPAAEPEVVVKADEVAEDAVIVNADDVEPAVRTDDAQPAAKPEETPTPENIVHDAEAIPAAEIPAEHRSMWKSCQERINKILSGAGKLAMGEVKTVLSDLKTLYNAVKNVKVRTQIARLSKRIQAYAKSKLTRVDNPKRSTIVENYQVPEKYSLISDKKGVQIYRSEEWNGYCTEIEVRTKNGKTLKVAERQIEYNKITNRTDYTYNNDGQFLQAITRDKDNIVIMNEVVDPDGISIIYDCENGYVYADIHTAGLGENQRSAYELPLDKLRMAQEGKNPGITAANIAGLSNLPEGRIKYGEPFQRVTTDEEADAVFRDFVQRKSTRTTLDNTNERFRIIETTNDKNAEFKIMDGWAKHYTNTEQGTPWKIHIYADTPTEWANAAQLCMPYLDKNGIDYKTISTFADLQSLAKDTQRGKAFTVYFKDEAAFLQTAQDLDRIFSNSGMTSSGKVANDAQIGESGFLSYRSEEGSRYGSYKPANAEDPYLNLIVKQNTEPAIPVRQNEHPESVVETPSARSLSPMEIGEIGEAINRARNNYALDQVQARINRLPDSPQKETLQRQANLKSRELRQAEEPAIPLRKAESGAIEPEVYQVDVSDQADAIIAEASSGRL